MILDELDRKILNLLRLDGRMANREIAGRLGTGESTIRNRLRRIAQGRAARVVAVADFRVFAFDFMMLIGIDVQDRPVERVASELAKIPAILSCNIVVGPHDIQIIAAVENRAAAAALIRGEIAKIGGVHRLSVGVLTDVLKYQVDTSGPNPRGILEAFLSGDDGIPVARELDTTDIEILRHLWRDARQPNQEIADDLGISEGTVRARIRRMIDDGAIRIQAIADMDSSGHPPATLALLGLRVEPRLVDKVAHALMELKESGFVATMVGSYDVIVLLFAEDRQRLGELFLKHVRGLPGVRETEASFPIKFAKFDFRFGRINPAGAPSGQESISILSRKK